MYNLSISRTFFPKAFFFAMSIGYVVAVIKKLCRTLQSMTTFRHTQLAKIGVGCSWGAIGILLINCSQHTNCGRKVMYPNNLDT